MFLGRSRVCVSYFSGRCVHQLPNDEGKICHFLLVSFSDFGFLPRVLTKIQQLNFAGFILQAALTRKKHENSPLPP